MSRAGIALGKTGEDLACAELERRGYAILARRYRRRGGEFDIIARDGATLVFVEVKAREGREFGDGAEAVTLAEAAADRRGSRCDYLMRHHLQRLLPAASTSCRFSSTPAGR